MTENYLPFGDPNEAVFFDRDKRTMLLASGDRVPILRYVDDEGEEVQDGDVDLHDSVGVVCGPLSDGNLLLCTIRIRDCFLSPAGAEDRPWQENRVQ